MTVSVQETILFSFEKNESSLFLFMQKTTFFAKQNPFAERKKENVRSIGIKAASVGNENCIICE